MSASKRLSAAITAGEDGTADSSVRDVCVDGGKGWETCVDRNMWYVCTEARMKRHDRGITAKPRRRVNDGVTKALSETQVRSVIMYV